jgi:hypothetical protein
MSSINSIKDPVASGAFRQVKAGDTEVEELAHIYWLGKVGFAHETFVNRISRSHRSLLIVKSINKTPNIEKAKPQRQKTYVSPSTNRIPVVARPLLQLQVLSVFVVQIFKCNKSLGKSLATNIEPN